MQTPCGLGLCDDIFPPSENYDLEKQVAVVFEAGLKSDEHYSLKQLGFRFEREGANSKVYETESESCACRAAYPFKRGNKTKFKAGNI